MQGVSSCSVGGISLSLEVEMGAWVGDEVMGGERW